MPFVTRSNNRILPPNARATAVASSAVSALVSAQRLKYHAAFVVQGYPVCVYHRLTSGLKCHCQNKDRAAASRLNSDGHASAGFLNSLLTGSEFAVMPYARTAARQPGMIFHVDESEVNAPSLYDDQDYGQSSNRIVGSMRDDYGSDPEMGATTIVSEGTGNRGPFSDAIENDGLTMDLFGVTDIACPVCFGSGFVGGFSILNGTRLVLNYQHPGVTLPPEASIAVEDRVPAIDTTYAEFAITLPVGGSFVDAVRVWRDRDAVQAKLFIDGTPLSNQNSILPFFDGRRHVLRLEPTGKFTHVEIQVAHSTETQYVDFPKVQRSNLAELIDSMEDLQLVASPMIPLIRPDDVISDGVHNKVFHVKSCTGQHDRNASVLGWECDVRVVQTQEVLNTLPRRRASMPAASPNTPPRLTPNSTSFRRT